MNILALDFETYFDSDYTLKKLTTEAYIRDPRFEQAGLGYTEPGNILRLHCDRGLLGDLARNQSGKPRIPG